MKLIQCKAHFAKKHCKLTMAALVPFLLFGCSGGKTEKSDAGEKSKDVQVQTTGSDEQRKLALGVTAVPDVSVSAVFGADADKLMAFGLKELGKSGDSLSLAGPVYKLSATAGRKPGPDGCYAVLPVNKKSICVDVGIFTTSLLIPSVLPGTAAAPGLGLTEDKKKYSRLEKFCFKAGLDQFCLVGDLIKTIKEREADRKLVQEKQDNLDELAASQTQKVPAGSQTEYYHATAQEKIATPPGADNSLRSEDEIKKSEASGGSMVKQIPRINDVYDATQGKIDEIPSIPVADQLNFLIQQYLLAQEEEEKWQKRELNAATKTELLAALLRKKKIMELSLILSENGYPISEFQTESLLPDVQETEIISVKVDAQPLYKNLKADADADADDAPKIQPSETVVGDGKKPLLPLPRDCTNLKCAQPTAPLGCENAQLKIPDGECCAQVVCAGGNSTQAFEGAEERVLQPPPPDCSTVMCAQVKVNPTCINPRFERVGCCDQFVECAGGYSTPSCSETVGCPDGKQCVTRCAGCSIDSDGAMVCPPNPCTSECS